MLTFECCNPLLSHTINPWSDNYTWYMLCFIAIHSTFSFLFDYSGGSSGGEGALLALDGSAIGVNYLLVSKNFEFV
jgi:Asp-tRNA(Asn)/Glu-tRNA(Gln) amidotransferase A subunit family amidase